MYLIDKNGIQVEISIIDYEFTLEYLNRKMGDRPHDNTYDPNWLTIAIKVETAQEKWEGQAACALVMDMERLPDYFEAIATDQPHEPAWVCFDMDFYFDEVSQSDQVTTLNLVLLYRYARPGDKVTTLTLAIDDQTLRQAAADLRQEIASYPRRSDSGSTS